MKTRSVLTFSFLALVSCTPDASVDAQAADVVSADVTSIDVASQPDAARVQPDVVNAADVVSSADVRSADVRSADVEENVDAGSPDVAVVGEVVVSTLNVDGGAAELRAREGASTLVVFLPGFQIAASNYDVLTASLGQNRSVLALDPEGGLFTVSHTGMRDFASRAIDAVPNRPARIVVVGHSLGGKLALMLGALRSDIDALITIDPVNGANPITGYSAELPNIVEDGTVGGLSMPVLVIGETTDSQAQGFGMACAPAAQNYQTIFDALSNARAFEAVGASHIDFVDDLDACGFNCSICNDRSADLEAVRSGLRALSEGFLQELESGVSSPLLANPPAPYVIE